jgi:DNA polymerase-1
MPRTLYLIDAFAQIFRAYYAIRGGMNSPVTSEPTHAVFGFTGMLLKLLTQLKPDYVCVAADTAGPTFRDEMYSEYKANRGPAPDDLHAQVDRIFELVELFGIPIVSRPGLEADDVIACITTAVLAEPGAEDVRVRIVSKDKDLEQLLSDRVSLYDIHNDATIDMAALMENKGVRPDQVIDLLALTGDSVDNVPGVDGIGPKTASQLLQQYGSIEGIYAHIDEIKGKRRENLERARETLPLSRALVTLRCDDDLGITLESTRIRPIRLAETLNLFKQLGFNRFQEDVKRLASSGGERKEAAAPPGSDALTAAAASDAPVETAESGDYTSILTVEELRSLVETLRGQSVVSVDTETTGLERDAALCGISLAWRPGHAVYVPVLSPAPQSHLDERIVLEALRPILEDERIAKCGHNLKFDAAVLLRSGVRLAGVTFDSMLASALLDPGLGAAKLDNLALSALNHRMIPISDLIGSGSDQASMSSVALDRITPYAAEDADIALRLRTALEPALQREGMTWLMEQVEAPLAAVLARMEANGILCDPDELARQGAELQLRAEEIRLTIYTAAGCEFDLNSTKQLAEVLFDKIGFKAGKKTKTGRSTDVEVLEALAADEEAGRPETTVPRLVLEYRQLTKLISTYLVALRQAIRPETGRIHTTFHQLVTATGRLASHGPNLQNIPIRSDLGRLIRKAFYAPPGACLLCADYSQIELRLLAHLSGDPAMIDAFERGQDIHAAVASQVYGVPQEEVTRAQRDRAKTINFGIIYGITAFGLSRRVEGLDVGSAARLIADYKARYAGIDGFLQECIQEAEQKGFVTTMLGRRRSIPEIRAGNSRTRALGERLAINSVVQGSAADLIKRAMVEVQDEIDRDRMPVKMLLQIHDELVFETPEDGAEERCERIRRRMESALELRVPLKVDCGIGRDWMSAK